MPRPQPRKDLTSTSYAVLALLAVRPATSYQLAKQVARGLRFTWPRAEGRIYDEPKVLVANGLATAKEQFTGQRKSTLYSISAKGRRALAAWLAEPGAAVVFEYEALLKVAFAEHGTKADLVRNLLTIRDQAEANRGIGRMLAEEYLTNGAPFPERLPLNGLMWNFLWMLHGSMSEWATWALGEVDGWPEDLHATPEASAATMELFRLAVVRMGKMGEVAG